MQCDWVSDLLMLFASLFDWVRAVNRFFVPWDRGAEKDLPTSQGTTIEGFSHVIRFLARFTLPLDSRYASVTILRRSDLAGAPVFSQRLEKTYVRTGVRYNAFLPSSWYVWWLALQRPLLPLFCLYERLYCFLRACQSVTFSLQYVPASIVRRFRYWRLDLWNHAVGVHQRFYRSSWWLPQFSGNLSAVVGTRFFPFPLALGVCIYCRCHTVRFPKLCIPSLGILYRRLLSCLYWRFVLCPYFRSCF